MKIDWNKVEECYSLMQTLEKENKQLKEEIERLKELCDKYEEEHKTTFEEWKKTINIINELERYINEEYIYDELGMKIFDASKLQDKLQELKGEIK